jgi:hypothetical protein
MKHFMQQFTLQVVGKENHVIFDTVQSSVSVDIYVVHVKCDYFEKCKGFKINQEKRIFNVPQRIYIETCANGEACLIRRCLIRSI